MVALAMLGMFVYALFGTSRQLAVTSTSSSAAMLAALVAPIAPGGSTKYALLVSAATVAGGVIFLVGGVLKLGAVSEFISKPVLKGFVFGLALTIMVKQAHKLAGVSAGRGNFFHQAWNVLSLLRDVNPWTLAVGAAAIGIMFLLGSVAPRAPSALVVLVLGILAVSGLGLKGHHVEVVGRIQAGMPSLSLPRIGEDDLGDVLMGAIGIVLVLMAEALAAARTFAAKHNYDIDPNQELRAMGAANIASGLFGGLIVGGGMSGTAANDTNGARSQLSTITASLFVALTLAFLLPLLRKSARSRSWRDCCSRCCSPGRCSHPEVLRKAPYRKPLGRTHLHGWRVADGDSQRADVRGWSHFDRINAQAQRQ
jgi:SulP family sulfate permease